MTQLNLKVNKDLSYRITVVSTVEHALDSLKFSLKFNSREKFIARGITKYQETGKFPKGYKLNLL